MCIARNGAPVNAVCSPEPRERVSSTEGQYWPIFTTNFTKKYNKMLGCPLSVLFTALNDINNTVPELALFQVVCLSLLGIENDQGMIK